MKTYKILAALLSYPSDELVQALPDLRATLEREALVDAGVRAGLEDLFAELETSDIFDAQERYVDLFDRVRSLSLHLFEHVHGESRDRGQAMVDLKALYARHGFALAPSELPDFIPAFLEFLSCIDAPEAAELLAEACPLLEGIAARLATRGSAYAAVFRTLLVIGGHGSTLPVVSTDEIRAEDDPAALDAGWAEAPAFGGSPAACGAARAPEVSVVQFHRRAA
ncbi:MAG: nitrate reductase molybdenum cofactor assembly chaperone [Rhodospirillaceae bacterium]